MRQGMKCKIWAILILPTFMMSILIWAESMRLMISDAGTRIVLRERNEDRLRMHDNKSRPQQESLPKLFEIPPNLFENALVAGKVRPNKVKFTFAISSIERQENATYIFNTIDSLLANANATQVEQVAFVILLADFAESSRQKLSKALVQRYENHFQSGLMRTIQAPRDFYPDLDNLKLTYNHPVQRVNGVPSRITISRT
ncbi:alpha-1,6-mannosyl-glycoprotein 4-beta-N-acetylglucosaminyltransferase-like [Liolophura sinensis]|uniref:alpha-1,6-mannosyl-glycoprotein 4-beta-N-acetylglucosaminyltransferase-like n=1 Tax=Liolophura sinensis TaxID=3198878 RepID=UPI0031589FB4